MLLTFLSNNKVVTVETGKNLKSTQAKEKNQKDMFFTASSSEGAYLNVFG